MHPLAKLLIGVILLIIPLGLYAYEFTILPGHMEFPGTSYKLHLLGSLSIILQGIIPPFVIVVGLFIIWLELDEWRIEKELRREEKKTKARGRPRKKK